MRLDEYVHSEGYTESRSKAQDIILAGCVFVNGVKVTSKAHKIKDTDNIEVVQNIKYVSRAGDKLEKAFLEFGISVENKICLDIGASTGGFTDCLLKYGAKKVYALDVGHNQLVYKLRNDNRVVSIEDFNAKDIKKEMFNNEIPSVVVSDVSFISISKIAPVIFRELNNLEFWVTLIKPQFEAERGDVSKGGIIRDDVLREKILNNAITRITELGFKEVNRTISPIKGAKGNIEYLAHFVI
ncbi:TlyA family RNA methyltransferase [Brachyspira hyodysenteriae]|uniref:TlyA family RNA methyltransferase n=1 Tax=Brachyspira hyodysenteriae TaxID=159 RepID=UPI0022CD32B9|nr:TlyA family RNA methyltransferase [Brachyspira hyodysenteriae]MCZ9839842.1 TlyA family RNA methyltransferase [Brachyspira hyodysenteriae]MCZ9848244.1 TlyA family RNA methyltransferase [Brachyspira hyodysenteriae]MCZ9851915.1 TlyA family RNA methyltransferase [Brachyspira hyodysenteriae]MCZ9861540.1 TlyA family RNA methyltransferase [Brachyspira hyodysenteriae]MCZ9868773.1 TlyA family RNA methyltransferase [Brachyspira hyodysenteriae]